MGVCSSNSKIKHPPTNTNQKPLTEFDGFVVGLKEKENKLTQNLQNEKNTNSKPKGENQSLELNDV